MRRRLTSPQPECSGCPQHIREFVQSFLGDERATEHYCCTLNECDREPTPYDTTLDMEVEDKLSGGDD